MAAPGISRKPSGPGRLTPRTNAAGGAAMFFRYVVFAVVGTWLLTRVRT